MLTDTHGFTCRYNVIAGFLSPSHDLHVQPKCKSFKQKVCFSASDRRKLARLACSDSDWIDYAGWESMVDGYVTAVHVTIDLVVVVVVACHMYWALTS